ncbi:MAG: FAD-binding protein [Clostridia bacterium]|nr:FAD-binding protein [Clostridia bacterium]
MKDISRRSFLKGALAGTAALGLGSVAPVMAESAIYTPGTYSAQAQGMGTVTVTMTFSETAITDVVLDVSGETAGYGKDAAEELKARLMAAQGAEIDAVSGSTITSDAVMKAADKCIKQAKGEIPVEVIEEKAEEADDGDWLGQEPQIADSEIVADYETEILVIGCGTAGMFAVCSAAEEGAKVIGIDRFGTGTGIRDDLGGIDSRYQKEWGTKIDKMDYIKFATENAGGHVNQRLIKMFCDNSGAVIDWYGDRLAERGVQLWHESGDSVDEAKYHHFPTGHSPRWAGSDDGNGNTLNGNVVLYDYAVSKGAEFHYNTTMIKLVKADGKVTGCIATNGDGKYVRYTATKGTVVCTGGYSKNFKMMAALQPWNLRIIGSSWSEPGAYGDGIKACLWAGAKMDETASMMMFDRCALKPEQANGPDCVQNEETGWFWMGSQPWLKINADGERFFNESGTYEGILHADEYNRGHVHYTLFDSDWQSYVEPFKMHGCSRMAPFENGADPNIPHQAVAGMLEGLVANGFVFRCDTIEELAEKLLLPVDKVMATVERYNALCEAGVDEDFGKEPHRLTPVKTAPFYGAKTTGAMLCTMDGIVIDTDMNALDTECNKIEGLYVIGNDSGAYFANTYPNLSTGMCCGRNVTFGYMIGKQLSKKA